MQPALTPRTCRARESRRERGEVRLRHFEDEVDYLYARVGRRWLRHYTNIIHWLAQ